MDTPTPNPNPNEKELLDQVQDIAFLETVPAKVQKMLYSPDGPSVLIEADGNTYVHELNEAEATAMSFVASGCAKQAHMPTVHMLLTSFVTDLGVKLERAVIERKDGGVFYARLVWRDAQHRVLTTPCGVADAITLCLSLKASLIVVRNVLDKMTNVDDWPYAQDMEELWDED